MSPLNPVTLGPCVSPAGTLSQDGTRIVKILESFSESERLAIDRVGFTFRRCPVCLSTPVHMYQRKGGGGIGRERDREEGDRAFLCLLTDGFV